MLRKDITIFNNATIRQALELLDKTAEKILLVRNEHNKLLGTITDGDIRRYILNGNSLTSTVSRVYNRNPIYLVKSTFNIEQVRSRLLGKRIQAIPVVDGRRKIIDCITWDEAFSGNTIFESVLDKIDIPVVIMAGGKGTRLKPFTSFAPKPLIPINGEPVIKIIVDGFKRQGVSKFYVIINYKGEMIRRYCDSIQHEQNIICSKERGYLGTIGGIKIIEHELENLFIVSNCDVIVKANLKEVVDFHKKSKAMLTILSSFRRSVLSYGAIDFKKGGRVTSIAEKPEQMYLINTGVYVFNKKCLKFIPKNKYFDMISLANLLIKNKLKVLTYPVNEKDYIDVGQWDEYEKSKEILRGSQEGMYI